MARRSLMLMSLGSQPQEVRYLVRDGVIGCRLGFEITWVMVRG